jgi:hypothetical protein
MGGLSKSRLEWHPRWIHAIFACSTLRQIVVTARQKHLDRQQHRLIHEKLHDDRLDAFGKTGFSERIIVSLNTMVPPRITSKNSRNLSRQSSFASSNLLSRQSSLVHSDLVFAMRTLAERSIGAVLPDERVQSLLMRAGKWTDVGQFSHNTHDPFISLSKSHAENNKVSLSLTEKRAHKMICHQIRDFLSSLSCEAQISMDLSGCICEESYVWCEL